MTNEEGAVSAAEAESVLQAIAEAARKENMAAQDEAAEAFYRLLRTSDRAVVDRLVGKMEGPAFLRLLRLLDVAWDAAEDDAASLEAQVADFTERARSISRAALLGEETP